MPRASAANRICPKCGQKYAYSKGTPWSDKKILQHSNHCLGQLLQDAQDRQAIQDQDTEESNNPSETQAIPQTLGISTHHLRTGRRVQTVGETLTALLAQNETDVRVPALPLPSVSYPPAGPSRIHATPPSSPPPFSLQSSPQAINPPLYPEIEPDSNADTGFSITSAIEEPSDNHKKVPFRVRQLPKRYRDNEPEGPNLAPAVDPVELDDDSSPDPEPGRSELPPTYTTQSNSYGVFREYIIKPSREPDSRLSTKDFWDTREDPNEPPADQGETSVGSDDSTRITRLSPIYPFNNVSELLYLHWRHNGTQTKSRGESEALVDNVIHHPHFKVSDLDNRRLRVIEDNLSHANDNPNHPLFTGATWKTRTLSLPVPCTKSPHTYFEVPHFTYRSILNTVVAALKKPRPPISALHYTPYRSLWESPTPSNPSNIERVFGELYTSDYWLREHQNILQLPPETDKNGVECQLERAIAGIMLWSDATQLASVGDAKLWPIYMYLGNQSKFQRNKASSRECNHIAYIPALPANVEEFLGSLTPPVTNITPTKAHLKRELFHAVWSILLDDELIHAYVHGIPVTCGDGVRRRIYIRIFSYSADYPEKVLIALIRDNGLCPCPLCTTKSLDIHRLGQKPHMRKIRLSLRKDDEDRQLLVRAARKLIYTKPGFAINSKKVDNKLKDTSLVPTLNAFSTKLGTHGFDFHQIIVPDIMHENLLGTWKALLLVILRLINAISPSNLIEFNRRCRMIPTFGRDTIRKFPLKVTDLKGMTAGRYQDLLLCILPALEGLLSEFEDTVMKLVFCAANWLSVAKLHMHTESTLEVLAQLTTDYGRLTRKLVQETSDIELKELPREVAVRKSKAKKGSSAAKAKPMSIKTFKHHMMSHYVDAIKFWGTVDSYSTAVGESEHKTSKNKWKVSNHHAFEIARAREVEIQTAIQQLYPRIDEAVEFFSNTSANNTSQSEDDSLDTQDEDITSISEEKQGRTHKDQDLTPKIVMGRGLKKSVQQFLSEHANDPAIKDFVPKLKDHILIRLHHPAGADGKFSKEILRQVDILKGDLYFVETAAINYTTYDIHRAQDNIHTTGPDGEKCNVMVYAEEEGASKSHPFWYARVVKMFSAQVVAPGFPRGGWMNFFWVRWFGRDPLVHGGWKGRRLDRIGFLDDEDGQFDFLDPEDVIRAAHLIPAFYHRRTTTLFPNTRFRSAEGDWQYFYVNRFVDRDMMMRYTDIAVGHRTDQPRESEPWGSREWQTNSEGDDSFMEMGESGPDREHSSGDEEEEEEEEPDSGIDVDMEDNGDSEDEVEGDDHYFEGVDEDDVDSGSDT